MEIIKDGKGRGYKVGVDSENRMLTRSVQSSVEHNHNVLHGSVYQLLFSITPSASNAPFLYIENNDDYNLILEGFSIRSSIDNKITLNLGDTGTLINGTNVVPVNLNAGSKRDADGVFKTLEKYETIDGGMEAAWYWVPGDSLSRYFNFEADIVVPKGTVASFYSKYPSGLLCGFIVMWWDYRQYQ